MVEKRTKKQKQKTAEKRKIAYSLSGNSAGVVVSDSETTVLTAQKATTPKGQDVVESTFRVEVTKLLYKDIYKTGIVTVVLFCILAGIYVYLR